MHSQVDPCRCSNAARGLSLYLGYDDCCTMPVEIRACGAEFARLEVCKADQTTWARFDREIAQLQDKVKDRPQKNPDECLASHIYEQPRYTGDILCRQCGHYRWDSCHEDPFHEPRDGKMEFVPVPTIDPELVRRAMMGIERGTYREIPIYDTEGRLMNPTAAAPNKPFNTSDSELEKTIKRLRRVMGGPTKYAADRYFQASRDRLVRNLTKVLWKLGATNDDFTRFKKVEPVPVSISTQYLKDEELAWNYCVEPTCVQYRTMVDRAHQHTKEHLHMKERRSSVTGRPPVEREAAGLILVDAANAANDDCGEACPRYAGKCVIYDTCGVRVAREDGDTTVCDVNGYGKPVMTGTTSPESEPWTVGGKEVPFDCQCPDCLVEEQRAENEAKNEAENQDCYNDHVSPHVEARPMGSTADCPLCTVACNARCFTVTEGSDEFIGAAASWPSEENDDNYFWKDNYGRQFRTPEEIGNQHLLNIAAYLRDKISKAKVGRGDKYRLKLVEVKRELYRRAYTVPGMEEIKVEIKAENHVPGQVGPMSDLPFITCRLRPSGHHSNLIKGPDCVGPSKEHDWFRVSQGYMECANCEVRIRRPQAVGEAPRCLCTSTSRTVTLCWPCVQRIQNCGSGCEHRYYTPGDFKPMVMRCVNCREIGIHLDGCPEKGRALGVTETPNLRSAGSTPAAPASNRGMNEVESLRWGVNEAEKEINRLSERIAKLEIGLCSGMQGERHKRLIVWRRRTKE